MFCCANVSVTKTSFHPPLPTGIISTVPGNRNSIFSLKFFWSFKNYFLHAFAMQKPLKSWTWGTKRCSSCYNCFIIFTTPVFCIQIKHQMQHDIFSCLQSFLLANVSPLSISFSLLPLQKRIHKLFIDIPEVSFTFLWRIWIYFYPTLSYAPVCFSKIIVSTRYAVPGNNIWCKY